MSVPFDDMEKYLQSAASMPSADGWGDAPVKQEAADANVDWGDEPVKQAQDKGLWQQFKEFSGNAQPEDFASQEEFNAYQQQHKQDVQTRRDNPMDIPKSVGRGLVKASAGFEGLIAGGAETVYDSGRIIGRELRKAVTGNYGDDWKETDLLTKGIKKGEDELLESLKTESDNGALRTVERVAEFGLPTQATVMFMKNIGKELIKHPEKLATKGLRKKAQEIAIGIAKDPKRAILMEQQMSALMATAGQLVAESGGTPTQQMMTEIATGLATGSISMTSTGIKNFIAKHFSLTPKQKGKDAAIEYLKKVAGSDPRFEQKLDEGIKLNKETGVQMDVPEMANSPELKAGLRDLEVAEPGGATLETVRQGNQAAQTRKAFPINKEIQALSEQELIAHRQGIESEFSKRADEAIADVSAQIEKAAPQDRAAIGEAGRSKLLEAKGVSKQIVENAYNKIGGLDLKTNIVGKEYLKALKGDKVLNVIEAETKSDFKNLVQKADKISLKDLRELDSKLGEIAENSRVAGQLNKQRTYLKLREAIDSQIQRHIDDSTPKMALKQADDVLIVGPQKQIDVFDEANLPASLKENVGLGPDSELRKVQGIDDPVEQLRAAKDLAKKHHDRFSVESIAKATNPKRQNVDTVSTEDFARHFIKQNSDTGTAKIEQTVKEFYNAYGDTAEAKEYMVNAFGALLKDAIGDPPNPKKTADFLKKHSRFLKEAGITDKFSGIEKSIKKAAESDVNKMFNAAEYASSLINKYLKIDNPRKAMLNAIGNRKVNKLFAEVDKIKNPQQRAIVKRGMSESLWDALIEKTIKTRTAGEDPLMSTGSVRKLLATNGDEIAQALGSDGAAKLNKLLSVIDRIDPLIVSSTEGIIKKQIDGDLVAKLMTGARAAAHGFVRPDLIIAQTIKRGHEAATVKEAHKILREAMNNPELTKELLKLNTTPEGKKLIYTMFAPLIAEPIRDRSE